jgi:hypothetical protein
VLLLLLHEERERVRVGGAPPAAVAIRRRCAPSPLSPSANRWNERTKARRVRASIGEGASSGISSSGVRCRSALAWKWAIQSAAVAMRAVPPVLVRASRSVSVCVIEVMSSR